MWNSVRTEGLMFTGECRFCVVVQLNFETKIGNKILNTILMIAMHHAIKEVTVSHEGLNYLRDRQETINDTAL